MYITDARKRDITHSASHQFRHSVLIDSIGNAAADHSLDTIITHISAPHPLTIQHSALRALRHYKNEKSAKALLKTALDSNIHHSLRHAAAHGYHQCPLRERDLTDIIEETSHHLSRHARAVTATPGLTENVYNVSAPGVGWSRRFGGDNISTELSNRQINDYIISTDPFSTTYEFSLHSATWVDTFLELSDAPEQFELISTSLCYEGRVTYDENMPQNYQQNLSQQQYDLFNPLSASLANGIQNSADTLITSEANYDGLFDRLHAALSSIPAKLNNIRSLLNNYRAIVDDVPADNSYRQSADRLYTVVNGIYSDASSQALAAMEPISVAINATLPDGPARIATAAGGVQAAALLFSPRQTLNEIYSEYTRIVAVVSLLRQRVNDLQTLVDPLSVDDVWTNPPPALGRTSTNINRLVDEIDELIQYEVTADVTDYRSVRRALLNQLQPAVLSLEELTDELLVAVDSLYTTFQQTDQHLNTLTNNYEQAWFEVDSIFGQRFGPTFPDKLRSCDIMCGCGNYPATTGGLYPEGIDLITTNGQQIFAPFAGTVRLINSSDPFEADMHDVDKTVVLVLNDFNYQDLTIIITNISPAAFIRVDGVQMHTSQLVGVANSDVLCDDRPFIHTEMYKRLNGMLHVINPTQFLPVQFQPDINMELRCNDVTVMQSGMVVDKQNIAGQDPVLQLIDPPIVEVARNEFPQLRDYVLSDDYSYTSAGEAELFRDSTFLLVGPFPIEFSFSATGRYDIEVSIEAGFLSKALKSTVVQSSTASVEGYMRVGNALYAEVAVGGKLLESSVQGFMEQQWNDWPLSAKSSMNLKLSPSLLNLTAGLIRQTGAGAFADLEVLDSQILWQYSVPPVQREQYMYNGLTEDETAPNFTKLSYDDDILTPSCFVRQLPYRLYNQPTFEVEVDLQDCEDYLNTTFRVGTHLGGDDVFQTHIFSGQRIVVPNSLETGKRLFVSVEATNSMGLQSIARCQLFTYDTSPPMARINPRSLFSSHPFQLESLVVLFDEYGLKEVYEIAIATSPGDYSNVMEWKRFNTSSINTPPPATSSNLILFSAPRSGQLTGNVIEVVFNIMDVEDCALTCLDNVLCKSFDYSMDDSACVLHSDIEGPVTDASANYPNNFATPLLRTSTSFYHYEKLGIGNSTNHIFTDLILESGQVYYINVKLQNRLGYDNVVSSPAIAVDFTPPEPGAIANAVSDSVVADECNASIVQQCIGPITDQPNHRIIIDGPGSATVFNGPTPLLDALYTGANHFIAVNWDGFRDDESGIYGYTWCVGNETGSCNALDYQAAPPLLQSSQAWTNIGLFDMSNQILPDGPYYLSVQAINNAAYGGSLVTTVHHTTPYIVDTTAPLLQIIMVDPYDTVTNTLTVHYMASDDGSRINDVTIALGYTRHDVSLFQWTSVNTSGTAVLDVYLPNRINAYVKVRVTNNVGLMNVATWPSSMIVDRDQPAVGVVLDGDRAAMDIDYQSDTTELCVTFDGFHGAVSYSWAVGTTPDGSDIFSFRSLTASESQNKKACMDGLNLADNAVYYSTITAGNIVGLTQTVSSDGVLVDSTPPNVGRVYDGLSPGIDVQFSSNAFSVQAHWINFTDDESAISHYIVTVFYRTMDSEYTLAYAEQLSNWTQEVAIDRFTFDTGFHVLVQLEAYNLAGLVTAANTTGVSIDLSAPVLTRLNDVSTPSLRDDENYQNMNDMYSLNWNASDPDSNIVRIEVALFEVSEGRKVLVYPNATTVYEVLPDSMLTPTVHVWTVRNLNLTSGRTYVGTLLFTNGAGLQLRAETNGILVDTNPPELQTVEVLGIIGEPNGVTFSVTTTDVIEGRWQAIDRESNLIQYQAGIKDTNGLYITSGGDQLVDFGYSRGGILSGFMLVMGNSYQLEVLAIDQSGQESPRMTSRTFTVISGDTAGNVRDGEDPNDDIDYTDETTAVTTHFDGFNSRSCGGIVRYQWAVGIDGIGQEEVFPFTENGIIFRPDGSGKAQCSVPGLEQYGRQILYTTVRAITGCGVVLESSSDGFVIDPSPPEIAFIAVGANAIELGTTSEAGGVARQHQPYQTEQLLSATWTATDVESGMRDERIVKMGSYPGGSDIIAETAVTDDFVRGLEMSANTGEPNYVTVSVWNRAGVRHDVTAPSVAWDQTPPHQGEIGCDTFAPANWSFPSVMVESSITCTWSGFYDVESGIDFYSIMIGTMPGEGNLQTAFVIPESTSYNSPVLQFELTLEYYVTFRVSNRAGIQANIVQGPIVIATNIPVATGSVTVMPNYEEYIYNGNSSEQVIPSSNAAQCLFESTVLTVLWDPFTDERSGISKYQVSVGHSPGSEEVHSFQDARPLFTNSGSFLYELFPVYFSAASTAPVYVSVRGFNNAGYHTTITSNGIYIISDENMTGWVYDGGDPQVDIEYQTSTGKIEGTFSTGVNCPLASIQWAVEAADGMRVLNFTPASISDTFNGSYFLSSSGLSLYNGETYRIIVKATDQTGRPYLLKSDGVTVTTKPLFPGFVQDGPLFTHDLNYQESLTTLSGHWSNFGDGTPEQEIAYYEVALGSDREYPSTRTNIVPFTNIGTNISYTFIDLNLVPLTQQYFITVRAHAVSGAYADATSNGIIGGLGGTIIPGDIFVSPYQSNTTTIVVYWTEFESDFPIRLYSWAVGSEKYSSQELETFCTDRFLNYSEGFDIFGFTDVAASTEAASGDLNLTHGMSYYVTVRAIDDAKKCIAHQASVPTVIDTTSPVGGKIYVSPSHSRINISEDEAYITYIVKGSNVEVYWSEFVDNESNIDRYEISLIQGSECGNTTVVNDSISFINVLTDLLYVFEGYTLDSNAFIQVIGYNKAGLYTIIDSQPILADEYLPVAGVVKDGLDWDDDLTYQSDLTSLHAVFSHSKLRPDQLINDPCPMALNFSLDSENAAWTIIQPTRLIGLDDSKLDHQSDRVMFSTDPNLPGTIITATGDPQRDRIITGVYETDNVQLYRGGRVSLDIRAALETSPVSRELKENIVTSVVFIDTLTDQLVVEYDREGFDSGSDIDFKAVGLQIHHSYINSTSSTVVPAKLVLWSKQSITLASPRYASVDIHIDLSKVHQYEFRFTSEQPDTYTVDVVTLYVDGIKMAILKGLPQFSGSTRMLLHLFNRMSYTPLQVDPSNVPGVEAVYSEVRLPVSSMSICQYGTPFYDWGSPIVEFQVGIGSSIGVVDIQEFETLLYPCKPCIPGPCVEYACQPSCSNIDPYLMPITLSNLTLASGYHINQSDDFTSGPFNNGFTLSSFFTNHFQPAIYYVSVKAITASGQEVIGTSNGITIDITPPQIVDSIEHFDVEFSLTQPTEYQGNNHTIAAKWQFVDLESGIINYDWAIGSYPGGDDIQDYVSVGLSTAASNTDLEGNLTHNSTYYVTVRATNGALLFKEVTSSGITYIATELNSTALQLIVRVSHVEVFEFPAVNSSEVGPTVLRTDRTDTAAVSWEGVSADVSQIFWRIGTDKDGEDVFPSTEVSFGGARSARINQRTLDLDNMPFAGLAEIFSLAEGANGASVDDLMAIEPGRVHYHTIQFCSFAHKCVNVTTEPTIVIRSKDVFRVSGIGEDITLTISQFRTRGNIISVVDRTYEIVVKTTNGVKLNGTLMAGFLNSTNLRLAYRASDSYISNPFVTMARTSVEVARRFTTFGGPSFYVSFLGMETLLGPLNINVTFDRTLDWSHSIPELLYWDIGNQLWRAVTDTCASTLRVDWLTFTIATEICSTVVDDESMGSGSGEDTATRQATQRGYLERPIQMVVAQIGNASINTPPSLVIPESPLQVSEEDVLVYQVEYADDENDIVDFYLTSLPKYGYANITSSGLLTYVPCTNCIGVDTIGIYILERAFGVNIRMEASGTIQIQINNINDPPEIIFFDSVDDESIQENTTIETYIDANRTDFVSVAQIGAWDLDGSEDDLSVSISQSRYGQAQAVVWLDVVTTTESLPVNWSQIPSSSGAQYNGQVAFIGVNITYLPDNPNEADYTDQFLIFVRDASRLASTVLTVQVEVLYSLCQNNGVCNGSIDDPDCTNATARRAGFVGYSCTCPTGFTGIYCENQTEVIIPSAPTRLCPAGIPMVQCDGNPCDGATCPSHPAATCLPNYCGSCKPQWSINGNEVQCHANLSTYCSNPVNSSDSVLIGCVNAVCDCPEQQIFCPPDSILVETRIDDCCVQYECRCPNISCPLLMERGTGVHPVAEFRGNKFPGRCCPYYDYQDIDECEERNGLCSGICINEDYDHQCTCREGTTLAQDGSSCGVCYRNGQEYLFGDRVKVGCNWCLCMGDNASSERWRCTLQSCEPTCLYNGNLYPISSVIDQGLNTCTCIPTDTAATWDCSLEASTS